jgi:3-methyladenine DNA glycosylase AlkD
MRYAEVIKTLESQANKDAVAGMSRFGITAKSVYGVSIPNLRKLAKQIGKDHDLAQELWDTENRETRILAALIEEPAKVTKSQIEKWVRDLDSWEVCDQCCMNLLEKLPPAYGKAVEWSLCNEEFVKRAGYVLMARLAVSDKGADDRKFEEFFSHIKRGALDPRNFVKKAVNWALRQIGKRNIQLNQSAIRVAEEIKKIDAPSARWIASDALRELSSSSVQERLQAKMSKK